MQTSGTRGKVSPLINPSPYQGEGWGEGASAQLRRHPSRERQRAVKPGPPRSLSQLHAPGYNSSMPSLDQLYNLQRIQRESEQQSLPQQEKVFAVSRRPEVRPTGKYPRR